MNKPPIELVRDRLDAADCKPKRPNGGTFTALCPAHEDRTPSLSVTEASDGKVLVKCHAGCTFDDILAKLGLEKRDTFPPDPDWTPATTPALHVLRTDTPPTTYEYVDEDGQPLTRTVRRQPKGFHQEHWNGSRWVKGLGDTRRVLYRLPEVVDAIERDRGVVLVEGEKDADRLASLGVVATCNMMGAGKWSDAYTDQLAGARVFIVPDNDPPGLDHARNVATAIEGKAAAVHLVELPGVPPKGDVSDWLDAGHDVEELVELFRNAKAADPTAPTASEVVEEARKLRLRREAKAMLDEAEAEAVELPPLRDLTTFLQEPDPPVLYRIDQVWPAYGNALLAAQYKAGKSTSVGNVLRSLVDTVPLFGKYPPSKPHGRVALVDDELHEHTLRRWLRDQNIDNTDDVVLVALKGRVGTFDVFSETGRARWAQNLRDAEVSVLVVDCLRPILDAFGLDENHDVGRLLVALEALAAEAGIDELLVVHHMGHQGERSRGDSRLRDWPDVEWKLVRQSLDDENSPRFFSAYGRDVDEPEQQLELLDGRHLRIVGGSRREQVLGELTDAIVEAVEASPGIGARGLRDAVRELVSTATNADVDKARQRAVAKGLVSRVTKGTKHEHHPVCRTVPDRAETSPAHLLGERAGVPIGHGTHSTHDGADQERAEDRHGTTCTSCGHHPPIEHPRQEDVGLCVDCAAGGAA